MLAWSGLAADEDSKAGTKKPFFLPIEIDADSGAVNGDGIIGRLLPAFAVPLNDRWQLANVSIILLADARGLAPGTPGNPEPVLGPKVYR